MNNKSLFVRRTLLGALITAGISAAIFLAGIAYAASTVLAALPVFIGLSFSSDMADLVFQTLIFLPIILVTIGTFSCFFKAFYYNYWRKNLGNVSSRTRVFTYAGLNFLASILLILVISATALFSYLAWRSVQFRTGSNQEDRVLSYTRENFDSLRVKMAEKKNSGNYPCVYIKMDGTLGEISYDEFLGNGGAAVVCDFPLTYKNARQFSICFPSETHECTPLKETVDGVLVK